MTTNLKLILAAALAFVPLPAFAQSAPVQPPPGWDVGNGCAKDVTTENGLEDDAAAYAFCRALEIGERGIAPEPGCNGTCLPPARAERVVTLEDICTAGYTRFTDEHNISVQCPTEPRP